MHDAQADPILKANFPEFYPDKHGACAFALPSVSLCCPLSRWMDHTHARASFVSCLLSEADDERPHTVVHLASLSHSDRALAAFHRRMAAGPADVAQRFKVKAQSPMAAPLPRSVFCERKTDRSSTELNQLSLPISLSIPPARPPTHTPLSQVSVVSTSREAQQAVLAAMQPQATDDAGAASGVVGEEVRFVTIGLWFWFRGARVTFSRLDDDDLTP